MVSCYSIAPIAVLALLFMDNINKGNKEEHSAEAHSRSVSLVSRSHQKEISSSASRAPGLIRLGQCNVLSAPPPIYKTAELRERNDAAGITQLFFFLLTEKSRTSRLVTARKHRIGTRERAIGDIGTKWHEL